MLKMCLCIKRQKVNIPNFITKKANPWLFPKLCRWSAFAANCSDTVIELQRQLNSIHDICLEYGMKFNERKTEIIVFRNGGPLRANEHW